jgi:hypothetical protein
MERHRHIPVILHRSGGKDARYSNVCGICGEHVERSAENEPWATRAEVDAYIAEQEEEAALETLGFWDPNLAPPRE